MEIENLFKSGISIRLLKYLNKNTNNSISKISFETRVTYSHTLKRIYELRDLGLLEIKKFGRICTVNLTEKGRIVIIKLLEVEDELK